jgi:biotin carboxylase
VSHCEWREQLRAVIDAEQITHIFPAHNDTVIPLLENEKYFGVKIVTSSLDTCRIARSKWKTVCLLSGVVPIPKEFDYAKSVVNFPVFLKPDNGCGSSGAQIARNRDPFLLLTLFSRTKQRRFMNPCHSMQPAFLSAKTIEEYVNTVLMHVKWLGTKGPDKQKHLG